MLSTPLLTQTGKKPNQKKLSYWDRAINAFAIFSETANIGIIIEIISRWFSPILTVAGGLFSSIIFIADPLIYFFKSLIRLTKIIGRNLFGVKFEEEKNGVHKYQTVADIASLGLFVLTIPLFFGMIIAPPVGITVAWTLALSGLGTVGYFDYGHQEKLAREKYQRVKDDPYVPVRIKERVRKEYTTKRNAKYLFFGLLIGLSFLLLCGSAAAFAPPVLVPILYIASKVASGYLGLIACGRFANWLHSDKKAVSEKEISNFSLSKSPVKSVELTPSRDRRLNGEGIEHKRIVKNSESTFSPDNRLNGEGTEHKQIVKNVESTSSRDSRLNGEGTEHKQIAKNIQLTPSRDTESDDKEQESKSFAITPVVSEASDRPIVKVANAHGTLFPQRHRSFSLTIDTTPHENHSKIRHRSSF